jgi:muramoyltetrapeptide carboxypeptidase
MVQLKRLSKEAKIGVIAPAFPPNQKLLRMGIDYLLARGNKVELGKSLTANFGYLAGNDSLRTNDVNDMFANDEIEAIFCARGGWGGLRILDLLDYDLIKSAPKLLVGYSDITFLQLAIYKQCHIPSVSGPMVAVEMGKGIYPFTEKHFWGQLENTNSTYPFNFANENVKINVQGQCEGVLLGGCLSMIAHLLGTPFSPDYSNSILFIEDIGEAPYKIDRYLAQLKQAGIFDKISGLIMGNFIDCGDREFQPDTFSVNQIVKQYTAKKSYPVISGFPYGHGGYQFSMPIGTSAKLDTKTKTLTIKNIFC